MSDCDDGLPGFADSTAAVVGCTLLFLGGVEYVSLVLVRDCLVLRGVGEGPGGGGTGPSRLGRSAIPGLCRGMLGYATSAVGLQGACCDLLAT